MPYKFDTLRKKFVYAGGIEDTFIPQERPGLRALEEYELTQHYQQWRGDLDRARSAGIKVLRWGVPWYRVEPKQGEFDWAFTDEVLKYMIEDSGIQPIIDLVHYGTPIWMEGSFTNPDYPRRAAEYAAAFTRRYKHLVKYYTPLNEPTVNAHFSGRLGEWPPYLKHDAGYVKVLLPIARGIQLTAGAIKKEDPEAVLVAVEAMRYSTARNRKAESAALRNFHHDLLCWDLVSGEVTPKHPLWKWLLDHGASRALLDELRRNPVHQDILGVNFYPWSVQEFDVNQGGEVLVVRDRGTGLELAHVLRNVYRYTGTPMMVTETSAPGDVEVRRRWMKDTLSAVAQVRREGVPVYGYTWFPIITMIGWEYLASGKPLVDHLLHLGLWDSHFDGDGVLVREETPLVKEFARHIAGGPPRIAADSYRQNPKPQSGRASRRR